MNCLQIFFYVCLVVASEENRGKENRIINGTLAAPGQFRFAIQLVFGRYQKEEHRFSAETGCSSSAIKPNVLLTAAHCIYDYITLKPETAGYQRMADYEKTISSAWYHLHNYSIHPLYYGEAGTNLQMSNQYDVALIYLDAPFIPQADTIAISNIPPKELESATAIGYGIYTVYPISGAGVLRYTKMTIQEKGTCAYNKINNWTYWFPMFTTKYIICAIGTFGTPCFGDSGGPLVVQRNNTLVQVAIDSYGVNHCSVMNAPEAFVSISEHYKWITEGIVDVETPPLINNALFVHSSIMSLILFVIMQIVLF